MGGSNDFLDRKCSPTEIWGDPRSDGIFVWVVSSVVTKTIPTYEQVQQKNWKVAIGVASVRPMLRVFGPKVYSLHIPTSQLDRF